jgi:hypothetical protein
VAETEIVAAAESSGEMPGETSLSRRRFLIASFASIAALRLLYSNRFSQIIALAEASGKPSPRSYAAYWYVDALTDSILEVKNNLSKTLLLRLDLYDRSGMRQYRRVIRVAPFGLSHVSVREALGLKTRSTTHGEWGTGERRGSAVGHAQLTVVGSHGRIAGAYSAWIVVEDDAQGLGVVAPFERPEASITTQAEGLWWLPGAAAHAYFGDPKHDASQNCSRRLARSRWRAHATASAPTQGAPDAFAKRRIGAWGLSPIVRRHSRNPSLFRDKWPGIA